MVYRAQRSEREGLNKKTCQGAGRGNLKHHLSLSESDRLRLLLKMFRGRIFDSVSQKAIIRSNLSHTESVWLRFL